MARTLGSRELLPLLHTLADRRWHSGERLAQTAGLTRAGLSKRIARLKALGLEVETQTGVGYRLAHPLDLLEADTIVGLMPPALRARVPVAVEFSVGSTNRRLSESGHGEDPQALLAEHQSAGRGRSGRSWHSPFGANLYLSLSWTFARWPAALTALPLAIGVATVEALRSAGAENLKLKWPNDLLIDGDKLGGILVEQRGEAGGSCRVVIGLGLNVSMRTADATVTQPWTSLCRHLERVPSRNALAARILEHWVDTLDRFAVSGFEVFAPAWRKLDATYRRKVTVQTGGESITGIAQGVNEAGALRVESADGMQQLYSGDVSLRLAPGSGA